MTDTDDRIDVPPEIVAYKTLLRQYLDRRPSGTRKRLAAALGTHRSFVSQITNPVYRVPIPANHVATIVRVCHLSDEERRTFLEAYSRAHELPDEATGGATQIQIDVPAFRSVRRQFEVIEAIEEMARRIIHLAQDAQDP